MALENADDGTPRNPGGAKRDDFGDFPRDQHKRPKIIRAELNSETGRWEVPTDPEGHPIKELVPFTRASTLGGAIEYQAGLHRWKTAVALWGAFKSRTLGKRVRALSGYSKRADKDELYEVIDKATALAEADEKADHGTALHSVFQRIAEGEIVDELVASGAIDPDDVPACRAFADAITRFDVMYCERRVVCDEAMAAGKYDIIVTPRRPMPVTDKGGEVIGVILPGDLIVVDNKTSATADYFGEKFCVQLWIYANGRDYNMETGERTEVGVRKDFALILHIPSGTGVDDEGKINPEGGSATWHWVDLRIGGELVKTARAVLEGRKIGKRAIIKADLDAEIPDGMIDAEVERRKHAEYLDQLPDGACSACEQPHPAGTPCPDPAKGSTWDPAFLAEQHAKGRFPDRCDLCNHDRHLCPGCGADTPHVVNQVASVCPSCAARARAEDAATTTELAAMERRAAEVAGYRSPDPLPDRPARPGADRAAEEIARIQRETVETERRIREDQDNPVAAPAPQTLGPDLQRAAVRNALLRRLGEAPDAATLVDLRTRAAGAGHWSAELDQVLRGVLGNLVATAGTVSDLATLYRTAQAHDLWSAELNARAGERKRELAAVPA